MNKIYRSIWNATTNTWTAAAETAKSRSKGSARAARSVLAAILLGGAAMGGASAAEVCATEDGSTGSLDAAGVCQVSPPTTSGSVGTMGSIGTNASSGELTTDIQFGAMSAGGSTGASAGGLNSLAIGRNSNSSSLGAVALGFNAKATAENAVALGTGSTTNQANTVSIGNATTQRRIVNMAAGTADTDAVNVSQLKSSVEALGGGATLNPDGTVQAPSYSLTNGGTQTTVGDALDALDGQLTTAKDNIAKNTADMTANTSAINSLTGRVDTAESHITELQTKIGDGTVGLVQQDATTNDITVAAGKAGKLVDFTGTDGVRKLTGIAEGDLSDTSTDAVTGRQLNATNTDVKNLDNRVDGIDTRVTKNTNDISGIDTRVTKNTDDISGIDTRVTKNTDDISGIDTRVTKNTDDISGIDTRVTKNTDDISGIDTRVTKNTDDISGIDTRVTKNTGDITDINTKLDNLEGGAVGLVQQDATTNDITVAAGKAGKLVDFTGTDGVRKLTGIAEGDLSDTSTDAVTGRQLHLTDAKADKNTADISTINTDVAGIDARVVGIDGRVKTNEDSIIDIRNKLGDGSVGLVQQDATTKAISVAAVSGGTSVDFKGVDGERKLTGLANGDVSAGSTDAVTGHQLNDTNTNLANLDTRVGGIDKRVGDNETAITNIRNELGDGSVGLVKQDAATKAITVAATSGGTSVDFKGADGERKLTGIAEGDLSDTSTDAVTGRQLHLTDAKADKNTADISTINTNVAGLTTRVDGIDTRVGVNETAITDIRKELGSGSVGLVQQDAGTGNITVAAATGGAAVNFAGTGGDRVLSGVAAGISNNDAVSVGQLKSVIGYNIVDPLDPLMAVRYDDASMQSVTFGTDSMGIFLNNVRGGDISAGSTQAVNGGQLFAMQEKYDKQFSEMDDRVGKIESGGGVGPGLPPGTGEGVGEGSGGPGSIVVGDGADASGKNSAAIGSGAVASGDNSTAIGNGAKASGENSMALGNGSQATRDNEVSIGAPGQERFLGSVKDGELQYDAVNKGQLDRVEQRLQGEIDSNRRDAAGGTATAVAIANLPQAVLPGERVMSLAGGTYDGESAMAIGVSTATKDGRWLLKASGSTNTRGSSAVGAGVGFRW